MPDLCNFPQLPPLGISWASRGPCLQNTAIDIAFCLWPKNLCLLLAASALFFFFLLVKQGWFYWRNAKKMCEKEEICSDEHWLLQSRNSQTKKHREVRQHVQGRTRAWRANQTCSLGDERSLALCIDSYVPSQMDSCIDALSLPFPISFLLWPLYTNCPVCFFTQDNVWDLSVLCVSVTPLSRLSVFQSGPFIYTYVDAHGSQSICRLTLLYSTH